jgi:hypothetical protein
MSEHDLEKLLGGFAADTLTPTERETLFRAALHDQKLFNALADEQALKELLADPVVRQRLLRALAPGHGVSRWRSWLDRFTSPAGLAWAGGVAVSIFAVVLGLRVYEESLRQASETTVLEEGRVQAPPKESEQMESKAVTKPESAPIDTPSIPKRREQAAVSPPKEEAPVSDIEREKLRKAFQQGKSPDKAPVPPLEKSAEQPTLSTDQRAAPASPPASSPDFRTLRQAESEGATADSARKLFYAQAPTPKIAAAAEEPELLQKTDRLALARKAPEKAAPAIPLALRYSFVPDERALRTDVAAGSARTVTFTVESNQDGYIQIWKRTGDSLPELVLPAKETGRISLKTTARERQQLAVPGETDQLIVRLSIVPFGPITRQEAVMAGRGSPTQLTEPVSATEEQATYVANPDVSATELAIEVPIGPTAR